MNQRLLKMHDSWKITAVVGWIGVSLQTLTEFPCRGGENKQKRVSLILGSTFKLDQPLYLPNTRGWDGHEPSRKGFEYPLKSYKDSRLLKVRWVYLQYEELMDFGTDGNLGSNDDLDGARGPPNNARPVSAMMWCRFVPGASQNIERK